MANRGVGVAAMAKECHAADDGSDAADEGAAVLFAAPSPQGATPAIVPGAAYCWRQIESGGLPGDAHALKEVLVFLEHAPDRDRADQHAAALASHLAAIPLFHLDPDTGVARYDHAPGGAFPGPHQFRVARLSRGVVTRR